MTKTKPIEIALIGAGARGDLNLATLARKHAQKLRFTAVAELDDERREQFVRRFGIPKENAFRDWQELTSRPQLADAAINALPCRLHYDSTLAALRTGYHVLLEKPMALTPGQSVHLVRTAEAGGRTFLIALQCRYNRIYSKVARMLEEDRIGRLKNIDCAENIGYWHFDLSYVRGIHHRTSYSHSFVMAKAIHDLDLVTWFAGAPAARVSSFGSLSFFNEGNAPPGAPERCTDGCPVEKSCEHSAIRQYLKPGRPQIPLSLFSGMTWEALVDCVKNPRFRTLASVIVHDISRPSRLKALKEGPYGRCVFRSENDVTDHQTVSVEYENGVTASFSLSAFSLIWERTLNLHGTRGEVRSADFSGRLELRTFNPARVKKERVRYHGIFHGGGDETLLVKFADAVRAGCSGEALVSARNCLESHLVCFAAEEARLEGKVIDMIEFRERAEEEAEELEARG